MKNFILFNLSLLLFSFHVSLSAADCSSPKKVIIDENSFRSYGNDAISQVFKNLEKDYEMTSLVLSRLSLSSKDAKEIANLLIVNPLIKELDLSFNPLGNEGAIFLAKALEFNSCLEKLNLMYCQIEDKGILAINEALNKNRSLKELVINSHLCSEQNWDQLIATLDQR